MIRSACYVACDGPCDGVHVAEVVTDGAKHAREAARYAGFVQVRQGGRLYDLCPACQEELYDHPEGER